MLKLLLGSEYMKKLNLILITIFSIVGALIIYNYFSKHTDNNEKRIKANTDYNLVTNSILYNKSIDEINQIINKGTGIIFLCIKENEWCNYYASYINDVVSSNEIKEISYLDIKQDRAYNTSGYRKLINSLNSYLLKDDENNLRVFVPALIVVKNGVIIGYDGETAALFQNIEQSDYWNSEKIDEFKNKINNFIVNYKED